MSRTADINGWEYSLSGLYTLWYLTHSPFMTHWLTILCKYVMLSLSVSLLDALVEDFMQAHVECRLPHVLHDTWSYENFSSSFLWYQGVTVELVHILIFCLCVYLRFFMLEQVGYQHLLCLWLPWIYEKGVKYMRGTIGDLQ